MGIEYTNRARNISSGTYVYWTTSDSADSAMEAANAPSPSSAYADVVTVSTRPIREGLYREDLSSQIDSPGSTTAFTTGRQYFSGSLRVWWNGQRQNQSQFSETGQSTFSLTGFTAEDGDAIEVEYRPV